MSYAPDELKGVCGMMPAFATPDASNILATNTVDVQNLQEGVDKIINDGIGMIATTGSFGQCWNLMWDEFTTLVDATIEAVDQRVPLMLGVTSTNPREVAQKMRFVRDAGGQGVLLGVPYYSTMPIPKVIDFYKEVAETFPDMSIMIYHNPVNHRVHIPVRAFPELVKNPNIVAMKDSHRDTREMGPLHKVIHGKIAHFVNQAQLYPYYDMGASGCWSIDAWMGPWPVIRIYQACVDGDYAKAREVIDEVTGGGGGARPAGGEEGEGGGGANPQEFAGYIKPGPARPPATYAVSGDGERARKRAERWVDLCNKYKPEVEAWRAAHKS
jgi:trans-o-hydroxybenzylidenepyruvate hydratase-aldolase